MGLLVVVTQVHCGLHAHVSQRGGSGSWSEVGPG